MPTNDQANTLGFQGSETSGPEVVIYPQGDDPVVLTSPSPLRFAGRQAITALPQLIGVQTNKSLDGGAGQWSLAFKPPNKSDGSRFRDRIMDNDWVDITFYRHGRKWHTMRGMVDDVREDKGVSGSGATSGSFTVVGRDNQKSWEDTPLYFDQFALEEVKGEAVIRLMNLIRDGAGSDPAEMVTLFLWTLFEQQGSFGRSTYTPPKNIPNISADGSFLSSIDFVGSRYTGHPKRIAILPTTTLHNGSVWDLAKEWSDPMFCELWTDLAIDGEDPTPGTEHSIKNTRMAVYFRDKPFPLVSAGDYPNQGLDSAWFKLPTAVVPLQQLTRHNHGRTGRERYNAFLVAPSMMPESIAAARKVLRPLWHLDDIRRHGIRTMDVSSRYKAHLATLITMTFDQRHMVRDWYGINPYLYNGNLELAVGRPDIRVGQRVRIPGPTGPESTWTYYVESVAHSWELASGIKTSLGVTRGFQGDDNTLLASVQAHVDGYTEPEIAGNT